MLVLRDGEDGEDEYNFYLQLQAKHAAWALWAAELCVEWNGGHLWVGSADGVEFDDRAVSVVCSYCHATFSDIYGDLYDMMWGEIDGIPVADGQCLSLLSFESPVNIEVYWHKSGWEYEEWEPEVIISSRR